MQIQKQDASIANSQLWMWVYQSSKIIKETKLAVLIWKEDTLVFLIAILQNNIA